MSAIIYARFSPRPDSKDCDSNENQFSRCYAYCDRMGYLYKDYFHDDAVSGKRGNRPALDKAIDSLDKGDILVVDSVNRLARDTLVFLTIKARVAAAGATVEFADGTLSEDTPESRLFQHIMSAFAQYDRERFSRRTKAGIKRKKERGEWVGRVPYGYMYNKETMSLTHHAMERIAITEMQRLKGTGRSCKEIAKSMESWGSEFSRDGAVKWNERTVRRILKREKEIYG